MQCATLRKEPLDAAVFQGQNRGVAQGRKWELPTLAVAAFVYAGWLGYVLVFRELPWFARPLLGGLLIALHGSLQHECIHGHPTPHAWLNDLIAAPPLVLFYPYSLYKRSHVRHHQTRELTTPIDDTESYYVTAAQWQAMSSAKKLWYRTQQTLLGRVLLGPIFAFWAPLRGPTTGVATNKLPWLLHSLAAGAVLGLAWQVGEVTPWEYVLCASYPGMALTLVRSFIEHRPGDTHASRSVIVESRGPLGLLFLYNGFHAVHHAKPNMPWYKIPRWYEDNRELVLEKNGRFVFKSYIEVFARFLVRPKDTGVLSQEH